MRLKISGKEAATYIILRRHGYSFNAIAEAFGRSTSAVYRRVIHATWLGILKRYDLRKLPYYARLNGAGAKRRKLFKMLHLWHEWILSEEGEPP